MKTFLKLNIGSNEPKGQYRTGWINIDAESSLTKCKARNLIIADACRLPFRAASFSEIRAIHVLEHLPRRLHLPIFKEISRVLDPGGFALVEVPNFIEDCYIVAVASTELNTTTDPNKAAYLKELIRLATVTMYGKGRTPYDFHHWGFTPWALADLGQQVGLKGQQSKDMVSNHHLAEPVILMKFTK